MNSIKKMRKLKIYKNDVPAGILEEITYGEKYRFKYFDEYFGEDISLTLPLKEKQFDFSKIPSVFDGLLPEGARLDNMNKKLKADRNDIISQLAKLKDNLKGDLRFEEIK